MAQLALAHIREAWHKYTEEKEQYTSWGILNLTSWLGERTGFLLTMVDDLQSQVDALTLTARDAEDVATIIDQHAANLSGFLGKCGTPSEVKSIEGRLWYLRKLAAALRGLGKHQQHFEEDKE